MTRAVAEKVEVRISREAYEKAKKFIEETGGFESVEEFIEFLIEEATSATEVKGLSGEDAKKVEERLKDLGYM